MGLFLCYKIITSVSVQKLQSEGGCWQCCACCAAQQQWCQDRAMGLFSSSQQVQERFMWFFWVGLSLEYAQAEMYWEQRRWLIWRRTPASSSSWQERGCQFSWCKGLGRCLDSLKCLTVPTSRICLSEPLGMAQKSLQGRGSPPRYPLATATSAKCAGTSVVISARAHRAARTQRGAATWPQPCPHPSRTRRAHPATASDHWHLCAGRIGVSPAPSHRAGGLNPSTSLIFF